MYRVCILNLMFILNTYTSGEAEDVSHGGGVVKVRARGVQPTHLGEHAEVLLVNFHEQILKVSHLWTSLGWLVWLISTTPAISTISTISTTRFVWLVWLVWLIRFVGLVGLVGLLPGLGLIAHGAGHAHIEGSHYLVPDSGARGAEVGHLAGLQIEAGEVGEFLQHLSRLAAAATWLVRLIGFVGFVRLVSTSISTISTTTSGTSTITTITTSITTITTSITTITTSSPLGISYLLMSSVTVP